MRQQRQRPQSVAARFMPVAELVDMTARLQRALEERLGVLREDENGNLEIQLHFGSGREIR